MHTSYDPHAMSSTAADEVPQLACLDVLVVGGGPAGAACALALRTHMPEIQVALVEASAYDDARLGENVSAALLPLLDYLDVRETFLAQAAHVPSFTVRACWGTATPLPQHSMRHWSGEGYLLDRQRFDVLLAETFHARGGRLYLSCRVETVERAGADRPGWNVTLRHESGRRFGVHARLLVDASGRKASLARRLGARSHRHDELIGVSRYFEMDPGLQWSRDILIESVAEGWWYRAPLPDHRLVVTLMTDAALWRDADGDRTLRWQTLLQQAANTRERVDTAAIAADATLTTRLAHSHALDRAAQDGWIAVGDAAASFDPLSSLGIGFALHSACHGARCIAAVLQGEGDAELAQYSAAVRQQFESYLPSWRNYYRCETRFASAPFWTARIANAPMDRQAAEA